MERKATQKLPSHTRIKRKNLTSINTESDKLLNLVTELRWSVLINEISSEFVRQPCAIWGERSKPRRLMALITFFLTYVYKTMTNLVSGKAKRSWDIRGKTYPSQYNYCARNEKKKGFKFRYLNCSTPGSGFSTYANITYCYIPRCILSHDFIFCGKVCYMYRFHSRASEINNYMTLFSHRVKKTYRSFFLFGTCFSFILVPIAKFKNANLSLCSLLKE